MHVVRGQADALHERDHGRQGLRLRRGAVGLVHVPPATASRSFAASPPPLARRRADAAPPGRLDVMSTRRSTGGAPAAVPRGPLVAPACGIENHLSGGVGFRAMTIRASEGVISGRSATRRPPFLEVVGHLRDFFPRLAHVQRLVLQHGRVVPSSRTPSPCCTTCRRAVPDAHVLGVGVARAAAARGRLSVLAGRAFFARPPRWRGRPALRHDTPCLLAGGVSLAHSGGEERHCGG